jgi:bifunctional non-homologous end joining protein LigD
LGPYATVCINQSNSLIRSLRFRDQSKGVAEFEMAGRASLHLRASPIQQRKGEPGRLLYHRRHSPGLEFNDHITESGNVVFRHARTMGLEGIVSKRLGSPYRSGRSKHWIKAKNPAAPAMTRRWEKDWNGRPAARAKPPSKDRR